MEREPETLHERLDRLAAMSADDSKWDLSENDTMAIRHALGIAHAAIDFMRTINELPECVICGSDEDHEPGAPCAELYDMLVNEDDSQPDGVRRT